MKLFGLVITTAKAARERKSDTARIITELALVHADKMAALTADRDSANRLIARLLNNGTELAVLWASVRQAGQLKQIEQVFKRLSGTVK